MNSKQLYYTVIVIGCLVLLFGCFQFFTNQPKQFNSAESEQTIFGRNDLGNYLSLQIENSQRREKSDGAKNIMIIGGFILIIGIVIKLTGNQESESLNQTNKKNNGFYYCSNCGQKIQNGTICESCNKH